MVKAEVQFSDLGLFTAVHLTPVDLPVLAEYASLAATLTLSPVSFMYNSKVIVPPKILSECQYILVGGHGAPRQPAPKQSAL